MSKLIIFVTMSLWDEPHRGRHHYARLLARRHTVVWVNRNLRSGEKSTKPGIEFIEGGLHVLHSGKSAIPVRLDEHLNINNWFRLRLLQREMKRLNIGSPDVVWCYDYKGIQFIKAYKNRAACIYFCNDWFGEAAYAHYEQGIAAAADHVIAASPKLSARLGAFNQNSHFVPHGLWLPHTPPRYSKKRHPENVGYVGTLNGTVDISFLEQIRDQTELILWLAGPIVEAGSSQVEGFRRLLEHPRVKYLGDLGTEEADRARSMIDILLLPYGRSTVREYGFPIKYFEYLGSGKPILSTDYMEWPDNYRGTVHIYNRNDDVQSCIETLYQRWDEAHFNRALGLAKESTWERRVQCVSGIVGVPL